MGIEAPQVNACLDGVPRVLVDEERQLLSDLLTESPIDGTGIDSIVFRARHHRQIVSLDRLETDRLIRKDQDRYFVSLLALTRMEHEVARKVLANADVLYSELRSCYLRDPRRPVKLAELAERASTSVGETRLALLYMLENPTWCSGRSPVLMDSPDAHLQVSEGVLRHETFSSLIEQLEEWRSAALRERPSWGSASTAGGESGLEHAAHGPVTATRKPVWFDRLPPDLNEIMGEVYAAIDVELRALPAMGIRAALDILFVKLLGSDAGPFEQKVKALGEKGLLSASELDRVLATIDVGNASVHRGHVPDRDDLETILVVCERLLESHFVLPDATRRLRTNTPLRHASKHRPP
jgi:Domain of unknown function (DUF4145)